MSKDLYRELEEAETWDLAKPEVRKPVKASRVVVSVAFKRDDFIRVTEYAERIGKKTSAFVREAAMERVGGRGSWIFVHGSGSTGTVWLSEQVPTITRVSGLPVEHSEKVASTTH